MPVQIRFDARRAGLLSAALSLGGPVTPSAGGGPWTSDDLLLLAAAALREAERRGPSSFDPDWRNVDAAGRAAAERTFSEELDYAVRWAAGCLRGLADGTYERHYGARVTASFIATAREGPVVTVSRGRRPCTCCL